jgi:hypothetical protein
MENEMKSMLRRIMVLNLCNLILLVIVAFFLAALLPFQPCDPKPTPVVTATASPDMEQRVKALESKVERLENWATKFGGKVK